MEIPIVVNSEGRQSLMLCASRRFTAQESPPQSSARSANGSPDQREDGCVLETLKGSLLEKAQLQKSFVCVSHDNPEFAETVCFHEQVRVVPVVAPLDRRLLVSAQLHGRCNVSSASSTAEDSCSNASLPVSVAEPQSDQVVGNHHGQTVDSNCERVRTDPKRKLHPVSNGDVIGPPKDQRRVFSPRSSPHPAVPSPVLDVPRIVKHNLSSITFSDCSCTSRPDSHALANESSDDGESSLEEEDEDDHHDDDGDDDEDAEEEEEDYDDDVFLELPQTGDRSNNKDKQLSKGSISAPTEIDNSANNCGYEAEEEARSKEPQEPSGISSPWSESMNQLMRKLDQLNLDIEEALSPSSSPSDTPCTVRKEQWGAASKSTLGRTPGHRALQRARGEECLGQDGSSAARSAALGSRARTKRTMFHKMTDAARAAVSQIPGLREVSPRVAACQRRLTVTSDSCGPSSSLLLWRPEEP